MIVSLLDLVLRLEAHFVERLDLAPGLEETVEYLDLVARSMVQPDLKESRQQPGVVAGLRPPWRQ